MKRILVILLTAALMLCGAAAYAETEAVAEGTTVACRTEGNAYIIEIPVPDGDMGWYADELDDAVVRLAGAEVADGSFTARYEAVGDGDATIGVRHYYNGFACDRVMTWDLHIADGAIQDVVGGSDTLAPAEDEQDPLLSGEWLEAETQFTQLHVAKGVDRGWDVEVVSPMTHGAYVFKATIYYDCYRDAFVYDKGKLWDLPADYSPDAALGEARTAGMTGAFALGSDEAQPLLVWTDDQDATLNVAFERVGAAPAAAGADAYAGSWASDRIQLTIEPAGDGYTCAIHWANSAFEAAEWLYEGCLYDEVSGGLSTFETGVKAVRTYDENGEVTAETIEYSDGAATFIIDDAGQLIWTDFKETPGENEIAFERVPDASAEPAQ